MHPNIRACTCIDIRMSPYKAGYLVNTMVGVTARLVSVAVEDHDLGDYVTEGE